MDCSAIRYYLEYFNEWAGLPPGILTIVAMRESGFNPQNCSFKNSCNWLRACGLMQLRPVALADIKRVYGIGLDPLDPIQAIVGAACLFNINRGYIQRLTGRAPDFWALIAAYNGGYGAGIRYMNRQALSAETRNYLGFVQRVLSV